MSVTEPVTAPAASQGTPPAPPPAPAAPRSTADIVKATEAEFKAVTGGGPAGTAEPAAAPTTPAADGKPSDAAAPSEPPAKPTTDAAAAAPAKVPYTKEEFAAFSGNYHHRDFDWDRWPPELAEAKRFAQSVASGYGKRHAALDAEKLELERRKAEAQPTAVPERPKAPQTAEELNASLEKFLNPETMGQGLREILSSEEGKKVLVELGYSDPTEREIVSELVKERTIGSAIAAIADGPDAPFPQYATDAAYREEVNEVVRNDPYLLARADSRSVQDATFAFAVANGLVTARRYAQLQTAFAERDKALTAREAALADGEAKLKQQIEAANRNEPVTPSVTGQASGATKRAGESVREIMARMGPLPVG